MRVLVIDPWGVNSIAHYLNGFCEGISKYADIELITNYHYKKDVKRDFPVYRWFFRVSEKMKVSRKRRLIRGVEYVLTYLRIMWHLCRHRYDVIHIEWMLFYKLDRLFISNLKKHAKVVYKAHNVVPHEFGERYIPALTKIYLKVDYIVVHGKSIEDELLSLFPMITSDKIIIQPHGTYTEKSINYDISKVDESIVREINKYKRNYLFFGGIHHNKGVDRLVDMWQDSKFAETLLVIAGEVHASNIEFQKRFDLIEKTSNILFRNEYVDENTLNYLIDITNLVILPYRHASMSGVLFTAAKFSKPVLCTTAGSLAEYVNPDIDSYVCDNSLEAVSTKLEQIQDLSNEQLKQVGLLFNKSIEQNYSWDTIGRNLIHKYEQIIKVN